MKLTRLELNAVRLMDSDGQQWLRLDTGYGPESWVWYKPTEDGFTVLDDETAYELEIAYRGTLS